MEEITPIEPLKKVNSFTKIIRVIKRVFMYSSISIVLITGLGIVLAFIYEDDVKNIIIKELNKHLKTEVRIDPKNIDLTVIKSFPYCALEFKQITALDAKEFKSNDTLLFAEKLSLAFNIKDLFNKHYSIKKIELENAHCYLKEDKKGNANYMVWQTDTSSVSSNDSLNFALENINLSNVKLIYKSNRQKIKIDTHIKQLDFKGEFSNSHYTLNSKGQTRVNSFKIGGINYLSNKNVKLAIELDVNENTFTIKKAETQFNATTLESSGSFVIKDSLESLDINFIGKQLDIESTLSLLPEQFQTKISNYSGDGEFYANGEAHYKANKPLDVKANFGIKQATITYKPQNTTLSNVNLQGSLVINREQSELQLKQISANLNSNSFSGDVIISHFDNPHLNLSITAKTKLEELIAFYPIDTLETISGNIDITAHIEGLISDLQSSAYSPSVKATGEATINSIKAKFKQSEKEINIPEGSLKLQDRHVNVTNLKLIKGNSDVTLTGDLPNFMSYLFDSKSPLTINASIQSQNLELEDFLFAPTSTSTSNNSVTIPDNIELNVNGSVNHFSFGKFNAEQITGALLLKNQKIALTNLTLQATDGSIKLNAFVDASSEKLTLSGHSDFEKLNISKLFTQLNNFGQTTLEDKNLKGLLSASIDFTGNWDKQLQVDLNSIQATSSILIERGELLDFKPLESLAKYMDINELKRIKFSTLQSTIDIKDKTITIPKTSIKSTALNLELWGKHSFDNIIDYHVQVLLSDLLAKKKHNNKQIDDELALVENDPENRRSVFIVMTGPIDNINFKYDRKGAKEKIKQDLQQEKQNLKQLLKEEFGLFKKDSTKIKETDKANQKFNIQFGEEPNKKNSTLTPKKKTDDNDDF